MGKRRFTDEEEAAIVTEYIAGASLNALGRERGVALETIRKALRRQGVARRPRGNRFAEVPPETRTAMKVWWEAGMTKRAIAEKIGMSDKVVSRFLLKEGIVGTHPSGPRHGGWKGGRVNNFHGYVAIWIDQRDLYYSMVNNGGYALEHRVVMARSLGRVLRPDETVHHINGDRTDNRLENLQLRRGRHGNGQVLSCGDCGSSNLVESPIAES